MGYQLYLFKNIECSIMIVRGKGMIIIVTGYLWKMSNMKDLVSGRQLRSAQAAYGENPRQHGD